MAKPSSSLQGLRNIGPTIAARLEEVGIHTASDLREVGAATAYLRIRAAYPGTTIPVCYYLYSLAGALRDVHWNELPLALQRQLLAQVAPTDRASQAGDTRARARPPTNRTLRSPGVW